jgi:hypothetical protein
MTSTLALAGPAGSTRTSGSSSQTSVEPITPYAPAIVHAPLPMALAPADAPVCPQLSPNNSTMHDDAQASDTSPEPGPVADSTIAYFQIGSVSGMCSTFVYDSHGSSFTIGFTALHTTVMQVDPTTLQVLATSQVPRRRGTILEFLVDPSAVFQDTSGGAYLFCDRQDRIVVPTANRQIWVIAQTDPGGVPGFAPPVQYDLAWSPERLQGIPPDDKLTATLPDWHSAHRYWFTSSGGLLGTLDTQTGQVSTVHVGGDRSAETIENSFSVGEDGAFVVSDHALYRFEVGADGAPVQAWRSTYDRGTSAKPGQISQGSGTTPTLLARFVAIGDNAEIMNVCVYDRRGGALVSRHPVFTQRGSGDENSFIGYRNSLIVGNTYGYVSPYETNGEQCGGLTRLDLAPDTGALVQIWDGHPDIKSSATPKLSLASGLIYAYTKQDLSGTSVWCLVGVDFESGEKKIVIPVAAPNVVVVPERGPTLFQYDTFDNAWGPLFLGMAQWGQPSILIGMIQGFLQITQR